jgi:hypothetical protein
MVADATSLVRELAMAGVRERHPNDPPELLRRRFADLWLGQELAAKAYGEFEEHGCRRQ